jgi:hypothetical protein
MGHKPTCTRYKMGHIARAAWETCTSISPLLKKKHHRAQLCFIKKVQQLKKANQQRAKTNKSSHYFEIWIKKLKNERKIPKIFKVCSTHLEILYDFSFFNSNLKTCQILHWFASDQLTSRYTSLINQWQPIELRVTAATDSINRSDRPVGLWWSVEPGVWFENLNLVLTGWWLMTRWRFFFVFNLFTKDSHKYIWEKEFENGPSPRRAYTSQRHALRRQGSRTAVFSIL